MLSRQLIRLSLSCSHRVTPLLSTFTRSIANTTHTGTSHASDRAHASLRSKRQSGEAEPVDAATAEQRKIAREAKKAKRAEALAAEKEAEKEAEKQAKASRRAAQRDSSLRSDARSKAEVIEKEVPLMDLTGVKPQQNKFADVLPLLAENNFPPEVVEDMKMVGDYATGSTQEILSAKLANLREQYGRKPYDTGSPEVQVAMLTERLKGYDRHMLVHKSDINSRRGFLAAWHRRRKLLKYMRRTRYETYAYIMTQLNLKESDIDNVGLSRTSGTQVARIKKD